MYIDSKESLNDLVSKFRTRLLEHGKIKFNSAHQLFARILNYKSQAALLADLPIQYCNDGSLNYSAIKDYYPNNTNDVLHACKNVYLDIFEFPLPDIDEVIKHYNVFYSGCLGDMEEYTTSVIYFGKNGFLDGILMVALSNKEYNYVDELIKNCWKHIDIIKCLPFPASNGKFNAIERILKKQKPSIEKSQKIARKLLENNDLDYLERLIDKKLINKNALASAIICLSNEIHMNRLKNAKTLFIKKSGKVKVNYEGKDEQMCAAFTEAIKLSDYQERMNFLALFSDKDSTKLIPYFSVCELDDFSERVGFINQFIKDISENQLSKLNAEIIVSAYTKSLKYSDWKERLNHIDRYSIDKTPCLKFIMKLPSILCDIYSNHHSFEKDIDKGIEVLNHYINKDFNFNAWIDPGDNKISLRNLNVVGGFTSSFTGSGTELFIYLFDRNLIEIHIEQAKSAFSHEADNQCVNKNDNSYSLENGFTLLRYLTDKLELSEIDLQKVAMQHAFRGNGLALRFIEENYGISPNFIFNEFAKKNLLHECNINTSNKKLIPLLIKASLSSNTRRQCLSHALLSYLDKEAVKPYLNLKSDENHNVLLSLLENKEYSGGSYSVW